MRLGRFSGSARAFGWALVFGGAWLTAGQLQAGMTDRYITQAIFRISADQTADFWLNGHLLFTQHYTGLEGGPQTRIALPDHLCYFQRNNTLAIRVASLTHPNIGVAYILRLILSDGSSRIFTSGEVDQYKALYLPMDQEPYGWQESGFDDHDWGSAFGFDHVPYAAVLPGPDGDQVYFISAVGPSSRTRRMGERELFRFQFHLDVLPNPRCEQAEVPPTPTPFQFVEDAFLPSTPSPTPTDTPVDATPIPPQAAPAYVKDSWTAPETMEVHWAPTIFPTATPQPTSTPTPVPANVQQPMSFYVSLMDGPGRYQLEVMDGAGQSLRTLLERDLTGSEQVWVRWDGKDGRGQNLPLGNYWLRCSKNGVMIRKMVLSSR